MDNLSWGIPAPGQKERGHAGFEDHPTGLIALVHKPLALVAIAWNRWSSSIGMAGRHQSEQVVVFSRCAHW
jgi:hypothetical protein